MKIKNLFKIFSSVILITPFAFSLTSCEGTGVRFANYESYMSNDLMDRLRQKYDIQYLTYESNETLEIKFSRSYDIAIPSTYEVINLLKLNKLEKIDWNKLDLKYKTATDEILPITTAVEAENLLSESAKQLVHGLDKQYENDPEIKKVLDGQDFHILDWGIPYFLQSFIFGYKGKAIPEIEGDCTMEDILNQVKTDDRFNPEISGKGKVGIADDYRTIYGASQLTDPSKTGVNPLDEETEGKIDEIKKTYSKFTENLVSGQSNLNSDSGMLITTYVDPKGMNGLFTYNGDILYSAIGAEIVDPFTNENFHVPQLNRALLAFDMIVINTGQSQKKQNDIYGVIRDGFLEGLDASTGDWNDDTEGVKHIQDCDENDEYIYGPMVNFDFVMYTSPYQKIDDYISSPDGDYFDSYVKESETKDMLIRIYTITTNETSILYLENPLSNLTKSNMEIAWRSMKENI